MLCKVCNNECFEDMNLMHFCMNGLIFKDHNFWIYKNYFMELYND